MYLKQNPVKAACLLLLIVLTAVPSFAQRENVWAVGGNVGVDFNGTVPVAIQTSMSALEGSATVCDKNGALLFYTNGIMVWDRNHNLMPNGTFIMPSLSYFSSITIATTTSQGAVIVPMPDSASKYYIFSLADTGTLYYSVVDMDLNNGTGDIVPGRKSIQLDTDLTEHMTAVAGDHCNVWLLTISLGGGDSLKAYSIDASGIDPIPVTSVLNTDYLGVRPRVDWSAGYMDVSPDRHKLAIAFVRRRYYPIYDSEGGAFLFDFNPGSGMASNKTTLFPPDSNYYCYGASFSPGSSKLYIARATPDYTSIYALYQFDVSLPDSAGIVQSGVLIKDSLNGNGTVKRGPDGNNYVKNVALGGINGWTSCFDVINDPDNYGAACNYATNAIAFPLAAPFFFFGYPTTWLGMPNVVAEMLHPDSVHVYGPAVLCFGDSALLEPAEHAGSSYVWNDNSTAISRYVTAPGIYWVKYKKDCVMFTDSFIVTYSALPGMTVHTRAACNGLPAGNAWITVPDEDSYSYAWSDAQEHLLSQASTLQDVPAGNYSVLVGNSQGCDTTLFFAIDNVDLSQDLGADTVVCKDDPINIPLHAAIPADAVAAWSTGSSDADIIVHDTGTYWVSVTRSPCVSSDSIRISMLFCDCNIYMPNAFSPNGDGKNDVFLPVIEPGCPVARYAFSIYNRWGQQVFSSTDPSRGWDGMYQGHPAGVGTYFFQLDVTGGTKGVSFYKKGDVTLIR